VSLDDPTICADDMFFSDAFRLMCNEEEEFHDAVEDHQPEKDNSMDSVPEPLKLKPSGLVGMLTSSDVPSASSSDGDDPDDQPDEDDSDEMPPGRCPNCRNYGWLANLCGTCEDTGFIYEEVEAVSDENEEAPDDGSIEEAPTPDEIDWSLGRCVSCSKEGTVHTACVDCNDPVCTYDFWLGKCSGCGRHGMHGTLCENCVDSGFIFEAPPSSDDASSHDDQTNSGEPTDDDVDDSGLALNCHAGP
jgi:hypothetical protein